MAANTNVHCIMMAVAQGKMGSKGACAGLSSRTGLERQAATSRHVSRYVLRLQCCCHSSTCQPMSAGMCKCDDISSPHDRTSTAVTSVAGLANLPPGSKPPKLCVPICAKNASHRMRQSHALCKLDHPSLALPASCGYQQDSFDAP